MKLKEYFILQRGKIENTLKNTPNSRKIIVLVLSVLLICGNFWYFIYQRNVEKISKLTKEVDDAKNRLYQLKKYEKMSKELEKQITEAENKLQEMLAYLPDVREIPSILEKISLIGSSVGLEQLVLFEPKGEEMRDYHAAITINLEMIANYHQMGMFFDELAHIPRVIKVKKLTVSPPAKKQPQKEQKVQYLPGIVNVQCTMETYRYVDKPLEKPEDQKKKETKDHKEPKDQKEQPKDQKKI